MGIEATNPEKTVSKTPTGDAAEKGATTKPLTSGESLTVKGGDDAARQYGKGGSIGDLPTTQNLLDQIKKDEKAGVHDINRRPFKEEEATARKMTPEDLRDVGAVVNAIKNKAFGEAHKDGSTEQSLGDALKKFHDDPKRLQRLADMVQLELERQNLNKTFSLDVQAYKEKNGQDKAALVVSRVNDQTGKSIFGMTTDGTKAPKELLTLFYD